MCVVILEPSALLKYSNAASCCLMSQMRGGHWGNQGGTRLDAAGEGDARGKAEVADIRQVPTHHLQGHCQQHNMLTQAKKLQFLKLNMLTQAEYQKRPNT